MKITVIIPTKNRAKDLLVAVNSVINQTIVPHEIVIVDQSEASHSEIDIKSLVEKTALKLLYIYDPKITGLVHAKQVGVANSTGDIICFLEDDIELEPLYIYAMNKAFVENPSMIGCCGVVTNLPQVTKTYVSFFHFFHRGIFYDQRVGVHGFVNETYERLVPSSYLSGGTSAYKRVVFDNVKFDTINDFFMLEDIDFSVRAKKFFGDYFYINTHAKLAHYMSPVNRSIFKKRYQKKLREFIVFYKKHNSGIADFFTLIWLIIGLLLEASYVSIKSINMSSLIGAILGIKDGILYKIKGTS